MPCLLAFQGALLIAVDESFTTQDHLRRGKPPPPLGSQSKSFKEKEPSLNSMPPIDPRHISQCCIESKLFPTVPIHFKFSYGEVASWADWGAQVSASSGTPKPPEFLNITEACEEELSTREADNDEAARGGLVVEENSNTSADSDLGSGEHPQASLGNDTKDEDNGNEPSCKDDSKAAEDVDIDQADGFLNDDVQAEAENIEVNDCVAGTIEDVQAPSGVLLEPTTFLERVLNLIKELIPSGVGNWESYVIPCLGFGYEKEKVVLGQFVKVSKLTRALELQCKEPEVEKLKLKKLVRGSSREIIACLQLAANQLHANTSSSSFERWCSELNSSPSFSCVLCMTVCIFLIYL
ncbi:hypothetical protein C1H46_026869 [Malus baccata]|uniref:Uncharacterized protein n=1 Tax=Malus baccata TaxID=106549 RepID=A0A540LM66_MALBA|nr:hypothetical protein C1H46_026869 [Malus baccata]